MRLLPAFLQHAQSAIPPTPTRASLRTPAGLHGEIPAPTHGGTVVLSAAASVVIAPKGQIRSVVVRILGIVTWPIVQRASQFVFGIRGHLPTVAVWAPFMPIIRQYHIIECGSRNWPEVVDYLAHDNANHCRLLREIRELLFPSGNSERLHVP